MLTVSATDEWRKAHPGARIGLLELSGVDNTHPSPRLDQRKRETEAHLREQYNSYGRSDFLALPILAAYERYYRRFDKTYHVLLQVESIVMKGKSLPNVSPLVDSNFIAEVKTHILTAGHDATKLHSPVLMDVSREGNVITQMNGASRIIRAGDMIMKDAEGICCSILYGQDNRSQITTETTRVLYVVYAPAGVTTEFVTTHLQKVEENVRLFSPMAAVEQCRLISAEGIE